MDLRKLDALVAEKVMGWTDVKTLSTYGITPRPQGIAPDANVSHATGEKLESLIPEYSTDLKAAFEVHRKIFNLKLATKFMENIPSLAIGKIEKRDKIRDMWDGVTPLEICLAALKAKGIDVSEWEK